MVPRTRRYFKSKMFLLSQIYHRVLVILMLRIYLRLLQFKICLYKLTLLYYRLKLKLIILVHVWRLKYVRDEESISECKSFLI